MAIAEKVMAAEFNRAEHEIVNHSTCVFLGDGCLMEGVSHEAMKAGVSSFWYKYVGLDGAVIGIDRFGESAPAGQLFDFSGFTVVNVAKTVKSLL